MTTPSDRALESTADVLAAKAAYQAAREASYASTAPQQRADTKSLNIALNQWTAANDAACAIDIDDDPAAIKSSNAACERAWNELCKLRDKFDADYPTAR